MKGYQQRGIRDSFGGMCTFTIKMCEREYQAVE
jgi:hypothetical protein